MHVHALRFGARELGAKLPATEASIAACQAEQVEAFATAVRLQREAGIKMPVAQKALSAMASAVAASFLAGERFLEAHAHLADLGRTLRIPEIASGSGDGCPTNHPSIFFTSGEHPAAVTA